jgi:hypothetical protein
MKFAVVVWTFCGGFVVAVGKPPRLLSSGYILLRL